MTAYQLLTALFNAGIAISVGATVLSLGMTFTVEQLVAPLHRVVLVIAMVVLNAILAGVLGLLLGLVTSGKEAEVRTTTGLVSIFRFGSLGLIIIGTQLDGDATYLGPAITFPLIDFILPLVLAVEIGHRARPTTPAQ